METKFPPLAAPCSLFSARGAQLRGDPCIPQGPTPLGSVSGDRRGGVCGAKRTPALWPLQDLPTPTPHSLEATRWPPAAPPGGYATRHPLQPRTLQTSGSGQRSLAAAGELGRKALVRQVNTRGQSAATLPTLPGYGRQGATRHSRCRDSRETPQLRAMGPGLRTHQLRRARLGSGSRLGSAAT